ncbi:UDP-glucuronosyltransferase 2B15-like [Tubulanus polymorphus]|uniref:UDP-glucuronosyltransferase 2B15-like n=1 Tax=Tubulanus polymorphus TaxID=672921 RepID=UPI003DA2C2B5
MFLKLALPVWVILSVSIVSRYGHALHGDGSGKILLLPSLWYSHIIEMEPIAAELTRRGHSVYMVLPETAVPIPSIIRDSVTTFIRYESSCNNPFNDTYLRRKTVENYVNFAGTDEEVKLFREVSSPQCRDLEASGDSLLKRLEAIRFDAILLDSFGPSLCLYKIAEKLGAPVAGLTSVQTWPWMPPVTRLPSITKTFMSGGSDRWNFRERIKNLSEYFMIQIFSWLFYDRESMDIARRVTKVWFIEADGLLDAKRIRTPNVFWIGGLTPRPARPLPDRLRRFVEAAERGVVLVSFGTKIDRLPENLARDFAAVFVRMKELSFVWKVDMSASLVRLSENVYNDTWIGQNDLLGHPNVKLFVTHCGNNGMYEALYHGVPMIGNPITGDQPYNCQRLHHKKFGLTVDIRRPGAVYDIVNKIRSVLGDKSYEQNIETASKIRKDFLVEPVNRIVHVIEQIVKYGPKQFEFSQDELSMFEILMVDIVVLGVLLTAVCVILTSSICVRIKRCTNKKAKIKTD